MGINMCFLALLMAKLDWRTQQEVSDLLKTGRSESECDETWDTVYHDVLPGPLRRLAHSFLFSRCCGKMSGWIRLFDLLGSEVGSREGSGALLS